MEARSHKWDDKKIEGLKKKKGGFELELDELGSIREMQLKESEASGKISGLEKKVQYAEIEKKNIEDKLSKLKQEKDNIKEEIHRSSPELHKLILFDWGTWLSLVWFGYCVGLPCGLSLPPLLIQYPKYWVLHAPSLLFKLEYEQKRDMDCRITKLESSLSALRNALNEVVAKEDELKSALGKATDDVNHLKEEVKEWKSKSEVCEKDIQEWKKKISNAMTSISKLNRQIKSKETQIEQLNSQKQEILEKCELENIILPTISDPMDTESSTPSPVLDFSQLSRSQLQDKRSSQREKLDAEYAKKIDALVSENERTDPNLKALDQYESLLEKERAVTEEFEAVRKEEKEITDKYNAVKQRRYELFMEAFNHISGIIDKIYKQLTKSSMHQLGGTAYLKLDNEDEPFLHGIKYTAMPPTKCFRDMEQLSGGERTVAALALLFSIHRPLKNRWSNEELMLATGTGGVTRLQHDLKLCSAYLGVHKHFWVIIERFSCSRIGLTLFLERTSFARKQFDWCNTQRNLHVEIPEGLGFGNESAIGSNPSEIGNLTSLMKM
ncbi:hypothetical protein TEA_010594 [Camellia sinensis var. sinensis]|uniref:RecF/RecN/SMC N-terminal domain-containing protein n=1 Tax=Camellia sinensis var. sinensis TaxID=542762 RepID=A0A4S4D6F5_CAMSN|nr:hypothetical protein TEA_010594 [Camellia sinensis var. sinensis]